jgi:hypothetical protein
MTSRAFAAVFLGFTSGVLHAAPPADCGSVSTRYFSWAALKVYPPQPTNPESEAWAKEQENNGASHYIAEYCKDGRIISLTKRLNKTTFFRYDYSYDGKRLVELRLTDESGNTKIITSK